MNARLGLSDLKPGLVIAGGGRSITAPEVSEFAARFGPIGDERGSALSTSSRKVGTRTASRWLICAIAEQLAITAVGTVGVLCIERVSWPNAAHAGDDLELKIEILDKYVTPSGAAGLVRWHWMLATSRGDRVLDLVLATLLEDNTRRENPGVAASPIAYKVSKAAAMLGVSRYRLYDAIRARELRAYRPGRRSDFMILAEDLRDWVTQYPVRSDDSGASS